MEGPPLGPGGEDITWPDQVAPRGRKASSTRKIKPQTSNHISDNYQLPRGGNHTRSTATTWRLLTGTIDWRQVLSRTTTMIAMRLLTPHRLQLTQAMHLFITTRGTAAIERTALGEDDQTSQAMPTQAIWINATNGHRHYRPPRPGVDGYPLYPGLRRGRPHTDGMADKVGR